MAAGLQDLFNQIIESEERTQEQKSRVHKLKTELTLLQKKTKECADDLNSYKGELVLKTQQLLDSSLQRQWLQSKAAILQKQLKSFQDELNTLKEKLLAVSHSYRSSQKQFCRDVQEFSVDYDLVSRGCKKREQQANQQLQELEEQEHALQEDLSKINACRSNVKKLQDEKNKHQRHIVSKKEELKKLENELQTEKETVLKLGQQKEVVSRYPQDDPEFKRLRNELDRRKKNSMTVNQF